MRPLTLPRAYVKMEMVSFLHYPAHGNEIPKCERFVERLKAKPEMLSCNCAVGSSVNESTNLRIESNIRSRKRNPEMRRTKN